MSEAKDESSAEGATSNGVLEGWQPMDTAPKDGTPIQARIPGHGNDNIIAWDGPFVGDNDEDYYTWVFIEDQEPPDSWDDGVCWTSNSNHEPSVQPDAWKVFPSNMEYGTAGACG